MNKFRLLFSGLLALLTFAVFGQEVMLHPDQVGSYTAAANTILVAKGGTSATEFKSAATLGLLTAEVDGSVTNEAQAFGAGGTTSPTMTLTPAGGVGGGVVTLVGAGGISLGQSAGTITITQTAGATYTGTAPVDVTGAVISLANSGATAGTFNNLTVTAKGIVTAGSNVAYLTAEVDGSTTNEIQALTRTSTNNTASLSVGGGSIAVEDLFVREEFAPTSGTTITLTGTLPTDVGKFSFRRNGLEQNYGSGKGVVSINTGTKVVTVTRAFASGEIFEIVYPKQ
jgi:hypothetical protein